MTSDTKPLTRGQFRKAMDAAHAQYLRFDGRSPFRAAMAALEPAQPVCREFLCEYTKNGIHSPRIPCDATSKCLNCGVINKDHPEPQCAEQGWDHEYEGTPARCRYCRAPKPEQAKPVPGKDGCPEWARWIAWSAKEQQLGAAYFVDGDMPPSRDAEGYIRTESGRQVYAPAFNDPSRAGQSARLVVPEQQAATQYQTSNVVAKLRETQAAVSAALHGECGEAAATAGAAGRFAPGLAMDGRTAMAASDLGPVPTLTHAMSDWGKQGSVTHFSATAVRDYAIRAKARVEKLERENRDVLARKGQEHTWRMNAEANVGMWRERATKAEAALAAANAKLASVREASK